MKKTLLCALALTLALGSALPGAAALTKGPAAGKSVKVGVIADVTGSGAVYGTMQKNAYDLANDDVKTGIIDAGGANLSFDVEDAASDPAQVVNLMQKFTTDGIFVTQWGSLGNANGQFNSAIGVAVDGDGNVLVTEENNRVQKFACP